MTLRQALAVGAAVFANAGLFGPALAQTPAEPYPTAAVLAAFRAACSDLSSVAAADARIVASGWTRTPDPDATPVGPLVRFGYEAGARMLQGHGKIANRPEVYSREIAGEAYYLVLSAIESDGTTVTGCRAYDPGEPRKLDPAVLSSWIGRPPTRQIENAALASFVWEPGMVSGQDSFQVYQIPAGSPAITMTKLDGIALVADRIGTVRN